MTEPKENEERRFSQEQYDFLMRCSEKKDMTEWNDQRMDNPSIEILLEGLNLCEAQMEGAQLQEAHL